jgi:S-adenosylmethionine:tRNA ribosyltransferase-isomerase
LKRSDFYYDLPNDLIAQHPASERDGSRLMVLDREARTIAHRMFREFSDFLHAGDCLVLNETRVFPARIKGYRVGTGGAVELLLLRPDGDCWVAMARPGRRLRSGAEIGFEGSDLVAVIEDVLDSGHRRIRFAGAGSLGDLLATQGHIPLPPYIRREDSAEDRERYQTVYARVSGSVAAPTAGLHFTPELLTMIEEAGVSIARVLLHVGPGTFKPVTADDVRDHKMDEEFWEVDEDAAEAVNRCRANGGRVIAVGTTSVRTLESAAERDGSNWRLKSGSGWTHIFIYPPYDFRLVDTLITNFHLPESTLLMLVSALAGRDFVMRAYEEAVGEKYRFYSYGDAMMIK